LDLVRSLWGVSSVEGRTRLVEKMSAMPLPLPKPRREKIALPPIAKAVAMMDTVEAKASDVPPLAIDATVPAALPERRPDAVRAWEPTSDNEPSTGAQKTQEVPPIPAVETAAIAATAARSAEGCQAAVRSINDTEPVRFARGKTKLNGPSRSTLDRLAAMAGACPQVGLKVVGHADARGRAKRNLVLSRQRARAVVTYLINKGIDAGRLEAVGYGEARPVAPNDTARNRAKNRRIELEITGTGSQVAPTGQGAGNGLSDR
jgi:outer membrane protein OmpA-like peptidoglycan-associated protein